MIGYIIYFFECIVYFWAGFVAFNVCHVVFCGVFGRWYFGKEDGHTVGKSARVAFISSFGSICAGSLMIAIIRAAEMVARRFEREAQESGNVLGQIVACLI